MMKLRLREWEWPTIAAFVGCYSLWGIVLFSDVSLWITIPLLAVIIAFQSSLQHEVIHGHPFLWQWLNEALVYPSLNLFIPFARFRDTHLAHHVNHNLTDPYDDPESNFLSPEKWAALCRLRQPMLRANGTLLGRLMLGPLIGQVYFMVGDWRTWDGRVALQWGIHALLMIAVLSVVVVSPLPIWAYLIAAYVGLSILKIRTFAEHQAHDKIGARSVVIEDRGPLAFLFLNNNYHAVHHMHPQVPWYDLPALYRLRKGKFLRRNQDYRFSSYANLFRRFLFTAKDPVIHPHWQDRTE